MPLLFAEEDIACFFPFPPLVSCSFTSSFFFLPPVFSRLPLSRERCSIKIPREPRPAGNVVGGGTSCARRVESLSRNRSGIPWDVRKRGLDGGGRGEGTTRRRDAFLNSPHSGHGGREGRRYLGDDEGCSVSRESCWNELGGTRMARWKINTTFARANIVHQAIISAAGERRGLRRFWICLWRRVCLGKWGVFGKKRDYHFVGFSDQGQGFELYGELYIF